MPASNVMKEFKSGTLHSGSKDGPVVKSPKQAKAIQLSELRKEGAKIPKPDGLKSGPTKKMAAKRMPKY